MSRSYQSMVRKSISLSPIQGWNESVVPFLREHALRADQGRGRRLAELRGMQRRKLALVPKTAGKRADLDLQRPVAPEQLPAD